MGPDQFQFLKEHDVIRELIREYIKENLTLDVTRHRGYYDENETFEVGLMLEGEEISKVSIG